MTAMAAANVPLPSPSSSITTSTRRQTLNMNLPSLHLGSFDGLSPERYTLPLPSPSPSKLSRQDSGDNTNGNLDRQTSFASSSNSRGAQGNTKAPMLQNILDRQGYATTPDFLDSPRPATATGVYSAPGPSARSPRMRESSYPPASSLPPVMALPPLPSVSPLDFRSPSSASVLRSSSADKSLNASSLPTSPATSAARPFSPPATFSGRSPQSEIKSRPLGPSLTIHIPRSSNPPMLDGDFTPPLVLKDSPSLARRTTIIEASPAASRASPMRLSQVMNSLPQEQEAQNGDTGSSESSPEVAGRQSSLTQGSINMPVARPTPIAETMPISPRRLEKKASMNDLKNASPASPTPKRSLPRPPQQRSLSPSARPVSRANPSDWSATAVPSTKPIVAPLRIPQQQPQPQQQQYTLQPPEIPQIVAQPRHQPNKSASSLPIVAGLADTGPYPSISRRDPSGGTAGLGRAPGDRPQNPTMPQEEICIECMMRDRDLADVHVTGPGAWERQSNIAWEDLKARETELLRSLGSGSVMSGSIPSLAHSGPSDDEEEYSTSPPSTNHSYSIEDAEARRAEAIRRKKREAKRAQRREIDYKVIRECGWRGFKWEEGKDGEGLPRGFRGCRGAPLSEQGIKAIMTKWPSASAHRAKNLDTYLYHQAILIREIRAEAQRLGYYPAPGQRPISDASVLTSPRTSSIGWSGSSHHARELSEHMRGAFGEAHVPIQQIFSSPIPTVRPSPSSPADLSTAGVRQTQPIPTRPVTHFYPDREATPNALARSPIQNRGSIIKTVDSSRTPRSLKNGMNGENDVWPPVSPTESGLRPFSFAVRAGARRGSSDEHSRKSFFGKFGGSVTSFFGGSQGGSGSMMDMHIGLDNDRQNQTHSSYVHAQPRAVSMASPSRPGFFSREGRATSVHGEPAPAASQKFVSKSISTSRLSQMLRSDPSEDRHDPLPTEWTEQNPAAQNVQKKKGFKGLFSKMRPKASRNSSSRSSQLVPDATRPVDSQQSSDVSTPLPPPPGMAYLSGQNARENRDRSGSTSSMFTDSSSLMGAAQQGQARGAYNPYGQYGMRSTSAPQASSTDTGSQSASPTSSKYRRESYASGRNVGVDMNDFERDRRGSAMEMLSQTRASENERGLNVNVPRAALPGAGSSTYPPLNVRPNNNKTTSSLSNSSLLMPMVETPPPGVNGANAFFTSPTMAQGPIQQTPTQAENVVSPNRFKSLPPLPPPGAGSQSNLPGSASSPRESPDMGMEYGYASPKDRFNGQYPAPNSTPMYPSQTPVAQSARGLAQDRGVYGYQQYPASNTFGQAQGRLSYEPQYRPEGGRPLADARAVKSMYAQHDHGSVGSFGIDHAGSGMKGSAGRKGLKSFFSKR